MAALGPNPAAAVGWRLNAQNNLVKLTEWSQRSRDTQRLAAEAGISLQAPNHAAHTSQLDEGMQIGLYGLFDRVANLERRLAEPRAPAPAPAAAAANIPPNAAPGAGGGTRRRRRRRRT